MESLMVPTAVLIAIAAGVYYVLFLRSTRQQSTRQPSWPKIKKAYTQNVTPVKKQFPSGTLEDFTPVGEMRAVHDVQAFFAGHGHEFSVYTIDLEQESVVFIRPVDGTNMKKDPFFYLAQLENAVEVLLIPFEQLQAVVDAISDKVAHVQEVFVFHTGRCGSTLLVRAVEATTIAQAVSQPRVLLVIYRMIIQLRRSQQCENPSQRRIGHTHAILLNEETTVLLLRNIVTLLNYYLVSSDHQHRSVIFYKMASASNLAADLTFRAFPKAKTMFLYRNGLQVYESVVRVLLKRQIMYEAFRLVIRLGLWRLMPSPSVGFGADPKFSSVRYHGSHVQYLVANWVGTMQHAVELQNKYPGYFFHAMINYPDLVRGKEETIRLLMEKLGIEWNENNQEEERQKIRAAFVKDSQEGSPMSSRKYSPGETWTPLSSTWVGKWEREYIIEVCRRSGNEILGPDFLFPDTMMHQEDSGNLNAF